MKIKMFVFLSFLLSISAYAGDLYLICSTNYGSDNQEEEFYFDRYFSSSSPSIQASFYEPHTTDRRIEILFQPQTKAFLAMVVDVESGDLRRKVETNLKINEPVSVTQDLSCRISD